MTKTLLSASLLLMSLLVLGIGWLPQRFVNREDVLNLTSLFMAITLVLTTWKVMLQTANGRNILQQYFAVIFVSALWLLVLDVLGIIWHELDVIPRLLRVVGYRGLQVFAVVRLSYQLRRLAIGLGPPSSLPPEP